MWLQQVFILLIMCGSILALCQLDENDEMQFKIICENTTFDDFAYDLMKLSNQHDRGPHTERGRDWLNYISIVNSDIPVINGLFDDIHFVIAYADIVKINLCHVTTITENTFTPLISMGRLDLAFNEIEDLRFISGLPSRVGTLVLKNNNISSINFSLFNDRRLGFLDLSFNKIKEIDFSTVKEFPVLYSLNLENNHIITVDMAPSTTLNKHPLLNVKLANNPLQYLKNCETRGSLNTRSINYLDLSNSLTYIPLKYITQCKLDYFTLIVGNNNLTLDSSIEFLGSTTQLDYSNSSITHIPRKMFENRHFSYTLNLRLNDLQLLDDSVFSNSYVGILDLSNCKIKTVDKLFENMEANEINLAANLISELTSKSFDKIIGVKRLNLSFNSLKLKNNSFINCRGLLKLMLDNSNISVIEGGTFNGLKSLEKLYLENNALQNLPSNIFTPLISIKEIYLHNNRLEILRSNVFSSLPLRLVGLGGNNIELIEHRAFYNLSSLENIDINNNNASLTIEEHAFSDLPSLHKVNLTDSGISKTNLNMFHDTLKLQIIDMRNNNITTINFTKHRNLSRLFELHVTVVGDLKSKSFMGLRYLKNLTLWNSKIKTIKTRAFQNFFELTSLEIKNCEIELLEDGALDSLFKLQYIDLKNVFKHEGRLRSFTFRDLGSLKQLNLSDQGLEDISPNAFKGLKNLRSLYLNKNDLNHLNDSTFAGLHNLQVLDISYNGLNSLERGTFRGLSALTTLNLNNNRLKYLRRGLFQQFPNITSLNLRGNHLTKFYVGAFSNLFKLKVLDLAENNIFDLKFETILLLKSLTHLNLEFNNLGTFGQYNLITNLKNLIRVGIANNEWPCEYLEGMLLSFRNSDIDYSSSSSDTYFDVDNVDGIECM